MPRKLKYHESKLLRKVDFINWKQDANLREVKILRRYHVQDREDYHTYNKITGIVTAVRPHRPSHSLPPPSRPRVRPSPPVQPPTVPQLVASLKKLDQRDPVRTELTDALVDKLYALGLVPTKRLLACVKLPASAFCRRRLPVVMVKLRLAETVKEAAELVEQVRSNPPAAADTGYRHRITRTQQHRPSTPDDASRRQYLQQCLFHQPWPWPYSIWVHTCLT